MKFFGSSIFLTYVLASLAFLASVNCLFEDQIGKFDWRQQYVGKVKFTYIDPVIGGSQKFIVATEENVLACLSTRSGSIIWRQILEDDRNEKINAMSQEGDLITVSGEGQFIRSWDPNTGVLQWETSFPNPQDSNVVLHFGINSLTKEIIRIESSPKKHTKVSVYSFTRASLKTSDIIPSPWYTSDTKCNFLSSGYFACIESNKKILYLLSVKDSGTFIPITLKSLGIEIADNLKVLNTVALPYQGLSEKPFFALQLDESGIILQIHPPGIKLVKILPSITKITSTLIDNELVLFTVFQSTNSYQITTLDMETKSEMEHLQGNFALAEERGILDSFFVLPYIKKDHGLSYKMMLLFEDYSILVIHQQGRLVWSREEALSSIISTEILI